MTLTSDMVPTVCIMVLCLPTGGRGQPEITSGETRGPSPLPHGHELTRPVSSPHSWVPSVSFFFLAGRVVSLSLGAPQL